MHAKAPITFGIACALALGIAPSYALALDSSSTAFTFSEDNASLEITESGTYTLSGSCSEGTVNIAKGLEVTLILDDLSLATSADGTDTITIGKNASVTIVADGTSTIANNDTTTGSAAIKAKSGSSLTIVGQSDGDNALSATSAGKNAIKGAANATVTIGGDTNAENNFSLAIEAANNGVASDGSVTINGGTIDIEAGNDGIKAAPDETDTSSHGTITINGGDIDIQSAGDGIQADTYDGLNSVDAESYGTVTVNGGTISIETGTGDTTGDGIQATGDLVVTGGTIDITTFGGSNKVGNDLPVDPDDTSDTQSAKGLKSDHAITVSDGDITLNCADDAIHANATEITSGTSTTIDTSDGSGMVTISGGSINAASDDDGIHADVDLVIGSTNQATEDPTIAIGYALEGLEGATVSVYSGAIDLYTSDDGINAANSTLGSNSNAYPFLLTIEGGSILVNATATGTDDEGSRASGGDGLDSNGSIVMSGGSVEVYAGSNDNGAMDYGDLSSDGWTQTGGTIAAFGSSMSVTPTSGSQAYVIFGGGNGTGAPSGPGGGFRPFSSEDSSSLDAQSNTLSATATAKTPSSGMPGAGSGSVSISSGDTIGIYAASNASTPLNTYTTKASASYLIYSSPALTSGSSYTLASATSQNADSGTTSNDSSEQSPTNGETSSSGNAGETNNNQGTTTSTVAMYRLYNPNSGEHFYTASAEEQAYLVKLGWADEGIGWQAPQSGNAVYRLYNPNGGDHHYTASASERDWLVSLGWNYEGIGWYSDANKTTPLYRLYNPNAQTGSHHYTTSVAETNHLVELGWNYEGIGWYGA